MSKVRGERSGAGAASPSPNRTGRSTHSHCMYLSVSVRRQSSLVKARGVLEFHDPGPRIPRRVLSAAGCASPFTYERLGKDADNRMQSQKQTQRQREIAQGAGAARARAGSRSRRRRRSRSRIRRPKPECKSTISCSSRVQVHSESRVQGLEAAGGPHGCRVIVYLYLCLSTCALEKKKESFGPLMSLSGVEVAGRVVAVPQEHRGICSAGAV